MSDLIDRQKAIMDAESWVAVNECEKHLQKNVVEWLKEFPPAKLGVGTDTISRQAAIDGKISIQLANGVEIYSDEAVPVEYLKNLPTIQPEPQWIPVSERLPETEEFVLVSMLGTWRHTIMEHACEIADYGDGEWCVYAYPGMSAEKCAELIEAWMPLPEPYKEGGAK